MEQGLDVRAHMRHQARSVAMGGCIVVQGLWLGLQSSHSGIVYL